MSIRENYEAINESRNIAISKYNSRLNNENRKALDEANDLFEMRESELLDKDKYSDYLESLKESLLFEALFKTYSKSVDGPCFERNKSLMKNNLISYIKENGAETLLSKMRTKTYFLSELALCVDEAFENISSDADPENTESLAPDSEKLNDFMDRLNDLQNAEDVENAIRIRVANAEEEFVTDNMNDKYNATTIMNQTAQRIEDLKKDTYDGEDTEAEEFNKDMEEEKTDEMNHEMTRLIMDRDKGIFEQMVTSLAESVYKDRDGVLHETYTVNDKLDVDTVVESVKCVYALMEMLNTIKLESYNENVLHDFLKEF